LPLLVSTIKDELVSAQDGFNIKIIQLYYDCTGIEFIAKQEENITSRVAI